MPQWLRHQLLIVAVATPVLFFRLGEARLWDRDEPRNAQCVVEMLARGDWVVPFFNQELRPHKPVLLYWLMMSAYALFGVNEFAARFWSAALSVGTVLCTYHLGARLFNRKAGLWAALALAPALMFDVAARAATPDAALIFCVTATLCAYVQFAFVSPSQPRFPVSWQGGAIVYGLLALAVLAKGPVGVVLPVAIIAGSLWIFRCLSLETNFSAPHRAADGVAGAPRETWLNIRLRMIAPVRQLLALVSELQPLTALAMLLLIAAPWYAWVGWRTQGEFLMGFFWDHNVRRATETMEGHSGPAILFYPATLLIGFFPASIFLIPALLEVRRQLLTGTRQAAAIVFCLTWVLVVVGLFSLAKTKLPSYVTPCYPALAVLVGSVLQRWLSGELAISRGWLRWSIAANLVIGLVVVLGIYTVAQRILPGEEWLAGIGAVLMIGSLLALACDFWRSRAEAAAITLGSGLLFSLLLFGLGPSAADRQQQSHLLLAVLRDAEPAQIGAWRCMEPSWVFYLGRPIREFEESKDALEFLAVENRSLILRGEDYANLAGRLPNGVRVIGRSQRFLKDETLLVLGRPAVQRSAAMPPASGSALK